METVTDPAVAVVRRLYDAYNKQDLDGVLACWHPDGTEFLPLVGEMRPDQLRGHLTGFYGAFPDARTEVGSLFSDGKGHVAAQVTLSGTFTGGRFDGLVANGAHWSARMAEHFTVEDGLIRRMDAYMDNLDLAQQLKLLPPSGGPVEKTMRGAFNLKVKLSRLLPTRT
jgi:ketosteroid isomerase-like protein